MAYPEDIREHKEYRLFQDTFKEFSPVLRPESEDDWETEDYQSPLDNVDKKKASIHKKSDFFKTRPITRDEAARPSSSSN